MSIHVEELGLADSSNEYWNDADQALESTLTCYREGHLEAEGVYEILDDYFDDNYEGDIEFSDLKTEVEQDALAAYNFIDLTDESMRPFERGELIGFV